MLTTERRYASDYHGGTPGYGCCQTTWGATDSHYWQSVGRSEALKSYRSNPIQNSCTRKVLPFGKNAPHPEGNVYQKVGEHFEEQTNFPAGITFAPRSVFTQKCIFGPGSTFGTGCEFHESCIFGAHCVFDSQTKFNLPCVYRENCVFGINCSTAPNSFFEPGCRFVDQQNSIGTIVAKQEVKEDIASKLADKPKCTICKTQNKSHILIPCGHIAVCQKCSKKDKIKKRGSCPICKTTVQKILKVRLD